jgi:hypothetical protein
VNSTVSCSKLPDLQLSFRSQPERQGFVSKISCYVSVHNGTDMNLLRAYHPVEGSRMQTLQQEKVTRAYRIGGKIVLYRLEPRSLSIEERPRTRSGPWWNIVIALPLFLRTLLRLIFLCRHRHKGPPITPRESFPSSLSANRPLDSRRTHITCLDCGQSFAYNPKTRQFVDFWGIHDAEALAGLSRKFDSLLSPFRDLATSARTLHMGIPMNELVRSVDRLAILTREHWTKTRRLITSK